MPTRDLTKTYTTGIVGQWDSVNPTLSRTIRHTRGGKLVGSAVGVDNPNWRLQVAKGVDATTPYVRKEHQQRPAAGEHTFHWESKSPFARRAGSFVYRHHLLDVNFATGSSDVGLSDLALTRIKKKLASEAGSVNDLVPVVELREMRGLISSLAQVATTGLYNWASLLSRLGRTPSRRNRPRGGSHARNAYRSAQDAWLTFSFGLLPTISAVEDACDHIDAYINRTDKTFSVHGGARKVWFDRTTQVADVPPAVTGLYSVSTPVQMSKQLDYLYRGVFDLKLVSGNDYGLARSFGFIPEKLPSVGWELIPYSWAVDYFLNISQYLDDTFIVPPGATKMLYLNRRYRCLYSWSPEWKNATVGASYSNISTSACTGEYYEFQRSKLTALPHIGLRIKSTDEVAKYAVNKLLNLVSVLKLRSSRAK